MRRRLFNSNSFSSVGVYFIMIPVLIIFMFNIAAVAFFSDTPALMGNVDFVNTVFYGKTNDTLTNCGLFLNQHGGSFIVSVRGGLIGRLFELFSPLHFFDGSGDSGQDLYYFLFTDWKSETLEWLTPGATLTFIFADESVFSWDSLRFSLSADDTGNISPSVWYYVGQIPALFNPVCPLLLMLGWFGSVIIGVLIISMILGFVEIIWL